METLAAGSAPDPEYQQLYELQDRVLHTVFAVEQEFYLTGGTCLSRFYQAKRYSDDLDFFCNDSPRYAFAVRGIRAKLEKSLQAWRTFGHQGRLPHRYCREYLSE